MKDWHHIAIAEMCGLDGVTLTPELAAARLGIGLVEAQLAFDRLLRCKMMRPLPGGGYEKCERDVAFFSGVPKEAFGSFHRQMIGHALSAVDGQALNRRAVMGQTFAIPDGKLDEARAIMRRFLDEMVGMLETPGPKTSVYQLNVQFFELTDGRPKKRVAQGGAGTGANEPTPIRAVADT